MFSWGDQIDHTRQHTPRCKHCGDPYSLVDEHPDTRYAGLCPPCVEFDQEAEQRDLIERDADDFAARSAYYGK